MKWKRIRKGQKYLRRKSGITLVALVITIIVLLILAGVSIATITGQNSIPKNADAAVDAYKNSEEVAKEQEIIEGIDGLLQKYFEEKVGGEEPLITTATGIHSKTTEYQDVKGNKIVVPGGFEVVTSLATTVDAGIVIQDGSGNQFVWVPIGDIVKSDDTPVTIEFGRYNDFSLTANPVQYASLGRWNANVPMNNTFSELTTYRGSKYASQMRDTNATARSLQTFIENAIANEGYYIARYEASFKSGDTISVVTNGTTLEGSAGVTNQKPQFKQSTDKSKSSMNYSEGTLWNFIRQGDASLACQNLYAGNEYNGKSYVESDLVNSYAWDTAIMFIQKCSDNTTYWDDRDGSGTLKNTGTTTDNPCNIYDMKGNLREWTTEYSSATGGSYCHSCVNRGAAYNDKTDYTTIRYSYDATQSYDNIGFRAVLSCSPVS